MIRVKVCGIVNAEDAAAAVLAGADAIGVNFHRASPRYVGNALREIVDAVPPFLPVIGVFVDPAPEEVGLALPYLDAVQWHGQGAVGAVALPAWRAIRLRAEADLDEIARWTDVRGFVLDGPGRMGEFGGAGFDYGWFLEARRRTSKKLVLAGGLTPENVAAAIAGVRPDGVDVASGVESAPGKKDWVKIRDFVQAVRDAG